ncbi:hypothetical protein RR46_14371 [Papilio xuthus]|uniref:Uncharacterized protein n=1 Tax=Papilio xuthus TaxID=66420 RepID=A0A194PPU2_PAPXU|nr:hypothetical protein RR46_14371 [Papilio xuthus]
MRAWALKARLEGLGGAVCAGVVDDVDTKASVVLFKFPGAQNTRPVAHSTSTSTTHPDEPPMGSKLVGAATGRIYVSV